MHKFVGYEVIEEAGKGGIAVVYKALRLVDQCYVALKVVYNRDITGCQLLQREYEVLCKIQGCNVPKVYGLEKMGEHYVLISEYVNGKTLADLILEKSFSEKEIFFIILNICRVLQRLHLLSVPVVYCDLKPSNVIIGQEEKITLVDYGACQYQSESMCYGTIDYAAPELVTGANLIDHRADIYSIGILIRLLTCHSLCRNIKYFLVIFKCTRRVRWQRYCEIGEFLSDFICLNNESSLINKIIKK